MEQLTYFWKFCAANVKRQDGRMNALPAGIFYTYFFLLQALSNARRASFASRFNLVGTCTTRVT